MTRLEARGVRCLECKVLADLKNDTEAAKTGFGRCAVPFEHFVSILMSRNCLHFEPVPEEVLVRREAWAEQIPSLGAPRQRDND